MNYEWRVRTEFQLVTSCHSERSEETLDSRDSESSL